MSDTPPKIISEFSITNEGKERLQAFFDENLEKLQSTNLLIKLRATEKLADLIAGKGEQEGNPVFPKEALEEYALISQGKSELALLVHNCPERNTKELLGVSDPEHNYSYHIASALDKIAGAEQTPTDLQLSRSTHRQLHTQPVVGGNIHRDMMNRRADRKSNTPSRFPDQQYVDCMMMACPINDEHALTQVIHIRKALESIPEEKRKELKVRVYTLSGFESGSRHNSMMTLEELLGKLTPASHKGSDIGDIPAGISPEAGSELAEAIEKHSYKIDLQPGSLLLFNEQQIFHSAHAADAEHVGKLSQKQYVSRILLHHSTGVMQR